MDQRLDAPQTMAGWCALVTRDSVANNTPRCAARCHSKCFWTMRADWASWVSSVKVRYRTEPFCKRLRRRGTGDSFEWAGTVNDSFPPRCFLRNGKVVVAKLAATHVDELVCSKYTVGDCVGSAFKLDEETPSFSSRRRSVSKTELCEDFLKRFSLLSSDFLPTRQNSHPSAKPEEQLETSDSPFVDCADWYVHLKGDIVAADYACKDKREPETPTSVPVNFAPHELSPAMEAEVEAALAPNPPDEVLTKGFNLAVRRADSSTLSEQQWVNAPHELSPAMEAEVEAALAPNPPDEVLTRGFNLDVRRADLATLSERQCVNDTVVNFYMSLVMERSKKEGSPRVYAFSTFFYTKLRQSGHAGVKRWTRKFDLFSYDMVLVPVHWQMHWFLAVIDFRQPCIAIYDSLGVANVKTDSIELLKCYLQEESLDKRNKGINWDAWQLVVVQDLPLQDHFNDCGVFTCQYAECIARDAHICFEPHRMPCFRKRIAYEILHKELLQGP